MPYEYFDMIVCITLKENVERQQSFVKQMQIAGITNYEFFRVERHPEGGKKGCFDSHVRVWEYALSRGMDKISVFEDDTVVTPAYSVDVVQECVDFMKTNEWMYFSCVTSTTLWNDVHINFWSMLTTPRISRNVIQYIGSLANAYCISKDGMQFILNTAKYELLKDSSTIDHVDEFMVKKFPIKYVFSTIPTLFDQNWCFDTDNDYGSTFVYLRYFANCFFKFTYNLSVLAFYRDRIVLLILFFVIVCIILRKSR